MSTPLPKIRARYGEGIGVELFFQFPALQDDENSFLIADSAAGVGSLSANGVNFAVGQYIVIGQVGNEYAEVVQIHASTVPTSTTITLAGNTNFAHNRGDIIRFIPYNQIVAEFATSATGSFTPISAVSLRADSTETYMQRVSDPSTYYYRFRFYNATSTLYSAYSDAVPASGFADNTLWSVKRRAMRALGEKYSDLITDQDLNDWVLEGRRYADKNPMTFRWSFRTKFEQNVGYLLAGQYRIAAPTDLRDKNTYKNVLGIRMGQQNRPCVYQDRVRYNQNYLNVAHTTLSVTANFGDNTLTLTNSRDFDAAGVLTVSSGVLGGGVVTINYTSQNKATGVLSGVTGIPAAGLAATVDCWQRYVPGLPTAYTIDAGYISFDSPLLPTYDGQNVHMDYYTDIPTMDSDADTFDEPFYDLYVAWLKWKIKSKKANGKIDRNSDPDYQDWLTGLSDLIAQETPGQRISFIPDIEGFLSATE
jgi:hypothetical protein